MGAAARAGHLRLGVGEQRDQLPGPLWEVAQVVDGELGVLDRVVEQARREDRRVGDAQPVVEQESHLDEVIDVRGPLAPDLTGVGPLGDGVGSPEEGGVRSRHPGQQGAQPGIEARIGRHAAEDTAPGGHRRPGWGGTDGSARGRRPGIINGSGSGAQRGSGSR